MNQIYTLGTSNRSLEDFFEILKEYQIETVVDVRHFPTSRLFPHFKKENFKVIHIIEKGRVWEPKKEPKEIRPTCQKKQKHSNIL